MKKVLLLLMAAALLAVTSCKKDAPEPLYKVSVQLTQFGEKAALVLPVTLTSVSATFSQETDETGLAQFEVPAGAYSIEVSGKIGIVNYNGKGQVVVEKPVAGEEEKEMDPVLVSLTASNSSALIIKELYNGGCQKNDTGTWFNDKYIIIYNNSAEEVDASRVCLTMAQITNTKTTNKYTISEDGIIEYEAAGWTPANYAIWWFQDGTEVKIPAYSQITIAITGAIDHTTTYTNSVDLSGVDYCLYDTDQFNGSAQYPAPAAGIPTTHYMKTYKFGMGTAWAMPLNNATPYLILPDEGVDIKEWVKVSTNFDNRGSNQSTNYAKVPTSWVLDALEEWSAADEGKFYYRFPTAVNVGAQIMNNGNGYTQYRNVDKKATEAIAENEGKLVYDYAGAVSEDDTDPSGIDAEASIAKGAKIVYMDTNNSANDFHQRKVASLKK